MSAPRATLVVKFGGTSIGTPARIRRAARRVAALVASGRRVVVVVSAMGHTTDHILETLGALEARRGKGAPRARSTGRSRRERTSPPPSSPRR